MTNGMLPSVLEDYRRQIESVETGGHTKRNPVRVGFGGSFSRCWSLR